MIFLNDTKTLKTEYSLKKNRKSAKHKSSYNFYGNFDMYSKNEQPMHDATHMLGTCDNFL